MERGDKNLQLNCSQYITRHVCTILPKCISLLGHQVTRNETTRQISKINEYIEVAKYGFRIPDLRNTMILLELLVARIDDDVEYFNVLERLLLICQTPPILTRSSDVLTFNRDSQEYFSMLGYLLVCVKNENLSDLMLKAVKVLLSEEIHQRYYLSLNARIKFAEESHLPEILADLLEIAGDGVYLKLLEIILAFGQKSDKTCSILSARNALNFLFTRLVPNWRDRYFNMKTHTEEPSYFQLNYEASSKVIWLLLNSLTKNRKRAKDVPGITRNSLCSIQYLFRLFAVSNNKQLDRNNVTLMIMKLCDVLPKMDIVGCGLVEDLSSISFFPETFSKPSWCNVRLDPRKEDDYIFVKMLLKFVSYGLQYEGGIRILGEGRVIYRLLNNARNVHEHKWSQDHACLMLICILDTIKKLIPGLIDDFIESNGAEVLLIVIEKYYVGGNDIEVTKKGLEVMHYIINHDEADLILNCLLSKGAQYLIFEICQYFLASPILDHNIQRCLALAFCILNTLYINMSHECGMRSELEVDIIIKYIDRVIQPNSNEPVQDIRTIICVMDFAWENIIKPDKSCVVFIKRGGVYKLLDMIENVPYTVQPFLLGLLVDLCENALCVPYLITWRGQNKRILSLLLQIFKEENKRLHVKTGPRGQILDTEYPIMGKKQWIQTFCKTCTSGNPSIADLFVSARPKVYAIITMLNERYEEEIELANEQYRLYHEALTPEHQVTLLLAENFLALKLAEAWLEVRNELEKIHCVPSPTDGKIIFVLIDRAHKWASYLQFLQYQILKHDKEGQLIKEQKLYNSLQSSHIVQALEALNDVKYIARCSEHLFRITQKYIQQTEIEKSLNKRIKMGHTHRTFFSLVCITPVFNQIVSVESNKIRKLQQKEAVVPISTINSDLDVSGHSEPEGDTKTLTSYNSQLSTNEFCA